MFKNKSLTILMMRSNMNAKFFKTKLQNTNLIIQNFNYSFIYERLRLRNLINYIFE